MDENRYEGESLEVNLVSYSEPLSVHSGDADLAPLSPQIFVASK